MVWKCKVKGKAIQSLGINVGESLTTYRGFSYPV